MDKIPYILNSTNYLLVKIIIFNNEFKAMGKLQVSYKYTSSNVTYERGI